MADILQFPRLPKSDAATPSPGAATLSDVMTGSLLQIGVGSRASPSPAVTELQQQLKQWGFDPVEVDGIYGQHTADAVSALQRKLGISVDGKFGTESRTAIKADLEGSNSVIRAWQRQMGLVGTSDSDDPPLTPLGVRQPTFIDKLKDYAKSPYVWIGAAAIGAGGYWLYRKQKTAPEPEQPALPEPAVAGLEPYIPAALRVPAKRKRKTKKSQPADKE